MSMKRNKKNASAAIILYMVFLSFLLMHFTACTTARMRKDDNGPEMMDKESNYREKWGIEIKGIQQSAAGYMLDFRFRIIDPRKAAPLVDRRIKPYLIDENSGATFVVSAPPKVGALRTTAHNGKPIVDRTYYIMFANPGRFIKQGARMTLVIGDFRAENLVVN